MTDVDIRRHYGPSVAAAWAEYAEEYGESDLTPVELFAMGWRACEAARTPGPASSDIQADMEAAQPARVAPIEDPGDPAFWM